jgi:hypothetical protein
MTPTLYLVFQLLKVMVKEIVIEDISLFPNKDILTKEIESWKGFANSLSSKEDKVLFGNMLNDCYKYLLQLIQRVNHFLANH